MSKQLTTSLDLLVGRRIIEANIVPRDGYDDVDLLILKFDDGTSANILATYGGYTGKSMDEYPAFVNVTFNGAMLPNNGQQAEKGNP
jgi:hypothetical protein